MRKATRYLSTLVLIAAMACEPAMAAGGLGSSVKDLIAFSKQQIRYWTEDDFASSFRKMLTVEQYRSQEMNALYHQYLGVGPLKYVADLLGSQAEALAFYGPMHLLYSIYD